MPAGTWLNGLKSKPAVHELHFIVVQAMPLDDEALDFTEGQTFRKARDMLQHLLTGEKWVERNVVTVHGSSYGWKLDYTPT